MLSADDQERFSRHLLLDAFGGAGQERLCAGSVAIELPASFSGVAASCARALVAAGIGSLTLRGPWASRAAQECLRLAPGIALTLAGPGSDEIVSKAHEASPQTLDANAAEASAQRLTSPAVVSQVIVSLEHELVSATGRAHRLTLPLDAPDSSADAAALGALAALEAMKLLGRTGKPAPLPLSVFPAPPRREEGRP